MLAILRFVLGLLIVAGAEMQGSAEPARLPTAPARPVTDRYFETSVADPYRWMEDSKDPELRKWLDAQDDYARQSIARDARRASLERELRQLAEATTKVLQVERWGGRFFILRTDRSAQVARLFVRDSISGPDRLLIDPSVLDSEGKHYAIDYFVASPDGAHVAFGVSANGAHDRSVLRIVDVKTGKWLEDSIDRTILSSGGALSWMPDAKAFFYLQFSPPSAAAKGTVYEKIRVMLHRLGTNPAKDRAFFGYGVEGAPPIGPDDIPAIVVSPASKQHLFAQVQHGVEPELALYVATAPTGEESQPVWRKLLDTDAAVTAFDARQDDLYLLSHRASPKFQLIKTHVSSCDIAKGTVVADGGDAVIARFGLASDGIYLRLALDGGFGRIQVIPYQSGKSHSATTQPGAMSGLSTNPLEPGAIFKVESWTRGPRWYVQSPDDGSKSDAFGAEATSSAEGIESIEVEARSKDGTLVPLSIIYKAGTKRDGSHPTVLKGYGSYGISLTPRFDPLILPWLERGGIWAIGHVRGGGERGNDWHRSGIKEHKQNAIDDFIACAHYLIDHGYTSSAKLAAEGTSAGGLLLGAAITEDPALFAAAVIRVGLLDMLRYETEPNIGRINIPEFGTVKNQADFASLLRMSPYHRVRDGVAYPAVLLTTGLNDPNSAPWHSAKMAARLQAASVSGKPILLRVDKDAGHGSVGGTRAQEVARQSDELTFLLSVLR
jgi:prolyl oligopeptidase